MLERESEMTFEGSLRLVPRGEDPPAIIFEFLVALPNGRQGERKRHC